MICFIYLKRSFRIPVILLTVVFFTVVGCKKEPSSDMQTKIGSRLGFVHLDWNSDFRTWTNTLGIPDEVDQIDSAHTFFYWPNKGIAIFCHPLYNGQYKNKPKEAWNATSIFVVANTNEFPDIRPVKSASEIRFQNVVFNKNEIEGLKLQGSETVRYDHDGVLSVVEIRRLDGFLGDYN